MYGKGISKISLLKKEIWLLEAEAKEKVNSIN